ncbi:MAG: lysophospholipid acyltransferase family protein [Gemmatimonadota bacterium]
MRSVLTPLLRFILRIFFRRVDVAGVERVPLSGPVLFVINHPNGLIDPLFVLCFAPREVSFLGKAPLLKMPVIGWLARGMDTIPVYRRQDGDGDTTQNRDTFQKARDLLERGGTIAIAPEGVSHSDPRLKPLKTGAARIALGAATRSPIKIVPAGLYYSAKGRFRSEASVYFGDPIEAPLVSPDEGGEPPAAEVTALTSRIDEALDRVTLQADEHAAISLVSRAEALFSSGSADRTRPGAETQFTRRQRILAGYNRLRDTNPTRLALLQEEVESLSQVLHDLGVNPRDLSLSGYGAGAVILSSLYFLLEAVTLFPLALGGWVIHYPAYRLIGVLARTFTRQHDDVVSTAKVLGAMLLFPISWIAAAVIVGRLIGFLPGLMTFLIAPLLGYGALAFTERWSRFRQAARAFGLFLLGRRRYLRLVAARDDLRDQFQALASELGV